MNLLHRARLLKPKKAGICIGCNKNKLQLNKEFQYEIAEPVHNETNSNTGVKNIKDIMKKKDTRIQTLF